MTAHPIFLRISVIYRAGRSVHLTPDNGLDILLFAFLVEVDNPEHGPVIRYGQGIHSQLLGIGGEFPNSRQSVQKAVFSMYVKMRKSQCGHSILFLSSKKGRCPFSVYMYTELIISHIARIFFCS